MRDSGSCEKRLTSFFCVVNFLFPCGCTSFLVTSFDVNPLRGFSFSGQTEEGDRFFFFFFCYFSFFFFRFLLSLEQFSSPCLACLDISYLVDGSVLDFLEFFRLLLRLCFPSCLLKVLDLADVGDPFFRVLSSHPFPLFQSTYVLEVVSFRFWFASLSPGIARIRSRYFSFRMLWYLATFFPSFLFFCPSMVTCRPVLPSPRSCPISLFLSSQKSTFSGVGDWVFPWTPSLSHK